MKLSTEIRLMNWAGVVIAGLGAVLGVAALVVGDAEATETLGTACAILIGLGGGLHWMLGGQEMPSAEVAAVLDAMDKNARH